MFYHWFICLGISLSVCFIIDGNCHSGITCVYLIVIAMSCVCIYVHVSHGEALEKEFLIIFCLTISEYDIPSSENM